MKQLTRQVLVEACVDSVASALAAEAGGAHRLELCDNLADGGTTPSAGMIAAVKAHVRIPVFVIVRPRGGGFVYSPDELEVMRRDIESARELGVDGFVLGVLTSRAAVDVPATRRLVQETGGLPVTFHRAFDVVLDRDAAIEDLVNAGVKRILTSGGAPTAFEGRAEIKRLVQRADGRLEIMAGGGIRETSAADVARETGVREIHVRLTRLQHTEMASSAALTLRRPLPADEGAWEEFDESRLRALVQSLPTPS